MRLIYFDIPGKAEAIRLCAAVAGVPLEDVRVTRDEFAAMKAAGQPFSVKTSASCSPLVR